MRDLNNFFNPKNIAVIGASKKIGSVGYTISKNLKNYKNTYYINPNHKNQKLFSKKIYSSIFDIKNLDLAIICVPSKFVYDVILDISKTNCKNIILISAGFSEIGKKDIDKKIKDLLTKNNINLIGPNCLGVIDVYSKLNASFNYTDLVKLPKKGNLAFLSQSGALGVSILDMLNYKDIGLSKFISYGNSLDLSISDYLEYLEKDKKTDVIVCYIEGIKNGDRFFKVLNRVSKKKKVIILKGGRSKTGQKAASSHTAAIASDYRVFKDLINQTNAYLVESIDELFNLSILFSKYKNLDKLKNLQIITNGGGVGVLATDFIEKSNLELASFSKNTKNTLQKKLPKYATIKNPLDLTGDADNKRFIESINVCLKDKKIDMVLVVLLFQLPSINKKIINDLDKIIKKSKKPIFILTLGGSLTKTYNKEFEKKGILVFETPFSFFKNFIKN